MENDTIVVEVNKTDLKYQLAKVLVSTAAGFVASKLAENAFEHFVNRDRTSSTDDS